MQSPRVESETGIGQGRGTEIEIGTEKEMAGRFYNSSRAV